MSGLYREYGNDGFVYFVKVDYEKQVAKRIAKVPSHYYYNNWFVDYSQYITKYNGYNRRIMLGADHGRFYQLANTTLVSYNQEIQDYLQLMISNFNNEKQKDDCSKKINDCESIIQFFS